MDPATLTLASLHRAQTVHYFQVVAVAVFVYDYFTTLSEEIALIWPTKWGPGKILFLLARYVTWPELVITVYVEIFNTSSKSDACRSIYLYATWSILLGLTISDVILILRTWAIWGTQRYILGILSTLLFTIVACNCYVVAYYQENTVLISANSVVPGFNGCFIASSTRLIGIVWPSFAAFEFIIAVLTVIKGLEHFRKGSSNLIATMYRDGILYFIYLFTFSLANVVCIYATPPENVVLLAQLQRALHAIISCRIIFHLRAASTGPPIESAQSGSAACRANGDPFPVGGAGRPGHQLGAWFGDKPWQAQSASTSTEMASFVYSSGSA